MNEKQKAELAELQKLQGEGTTLDDAQATRLSELTLMGDAEKFKKDFETAAAQKDHFRTKFEKEEAERKALEDKLNAGAGAGNSKATLDVSDFIDISASLDGLDTREKEYLTKQHKLSGKPLGEIRKDEDFMLWQSAHRSKLEKEKTLKPDGTTTTEQKPQSFTDKVKAASMADKEKLLVEAGLYKSPRPRSDRQSFGGQR